MSATAFLALGSNLGDRLANLERAVSLLSGEPGIDVLASSRVWETDPIGPPQPDYLNAVLRVETALDPHDLLAACHRVEDALGRVRDLEWGPRTLDVDILLFGHSAVRDGALQIPHPRMLERRFVLLPLLELAPRVELPDGTRVSDARRDQDTAGSVRPFAAELVVAV